MTADSMTSAEFLAAQGRGKPKSDKRVLAGGRARAAGKTFEDDLVIAHQVYESLSIASIDQLPVPTNPMPRSWLVDPKKSGMARLLAKKQGFDFYGVMGHKMGRCFRGRAVAMEAKATADWRTSLGVGDDGPLRPHQLQALAEKAERFGCVSAIVWKNGELRGVLTPAACIEAWRTHRLQTRKSIPWSAFTPYRLDRVDDGSEIEDWLVPVIGSLPLE